MAAKDNLEDLSLEELRKLHAECVEDLNMFQRDVDLFRQAYPGRLTMYEDLCDTQPPSEEEDTVAPPPRPPRDSNKIKDKLLVRYLAMFTGVIVSDVSINTDTPNENGDDYFQYNVKCSVDKIHMDVTYSSNAKITENQLENIDDVLELKDVQIKVLHSKFALELQKTVDYYCQCPSYLGAFFLAVQEYSRLFNVRRQVLRSLLVAHEEYFEISLEDVTGHYVIECSGKYTNTVFFVLVWSVVFDVDICSVRDSFKINLHEDGQLVDDVNPLLQKLCKKDTVLGEDEKLKLLMNVMVAVKAADTRLEEMSTVSSNV